MKLEKKQRFSIRKYAFGAASVLIGFAFGTQVVSADGVTPAPQKPETLQTMPDNPQLKEGPTKEAEKLSDTVIQHKE